MRIYSLILFSIFGLTELHAQDIKVFSKYNYYTSEDEVKLMAEFPAGAGSDGFVFSVSGKIKTQPVAGNADKDLLDIEIPLSSFDMGKTAMPYTISKYNTVVKEGTIDIVRLKPKDNEVKIDLQTGGLIADGLPYFPFGFYCKPVANLPEQEVTHGFNMIGPYQSNLPATLEERKAYMDRCAQLGMKVQYSVNTLIGSGHNGAKGLDMSEEEKEKLLRSEIIAFRDHPALLSWYINDEPDGQGRPIALLEKAYQMVHELDPYHPISIVFMLPSKFALYRNCMDIAMTDPYPVPGPLNMVEQFVTQMNRDFNHEKSIWLVPQAFGGQEMWAREPTPKEIRLMTYLGLVNGVKAIQYYTHAGGNLNPQSVSAWSTCSDIAVEVNQMSSFLLSDKKAQPAVTADSGIVVKSFAKTGYLLIIAVNKENKPRPFSVQVGDARTMAAYIPTASLWFENRELPMNNGRIDDIIDALGTRVYLLRLNMVMIEPPSMLYPGNLTINPSFEDIATPGLPIGSNTRKSFNGKNDPGASVFIDPRQSKEGMFSLRMITPKDSTGNKICLLPVVTRAGNSYRLSVWAKAKRQDKMPVFRISIAGPNKEKTFTLTKDWQNYSFVFHSDSSYSSAIIGLDLIGAGTAWFDLLQMVPDPMIAYSINKRNEAEVSVITMAPGAHLRYAIVNGDKVSAPVSYKEPFAIGRPATIKAEALVNDSVIAQAQAFIPVNKALNKPATLASEYAPQYAGAGSASLTDGLMGSTAFKDKKWLGFSGKDVIATIDMQASAPVHSVTVSLLLDPNSGIYLPPKISLYTSDDSVHFKLSGTYINTETPRMGEPALRLLRIETGNIKARYIKIIAGAFGEIPDGYLFKGTQSWIFIDEIMVE